MTSSGKYLAVSELDPLYNDARRVQIGLVFLHLAVDSQSPQVRRSVIMALEDQAANQPQLMNRIVRESLARSLIQDTPSTSRTTTSTGEVLEVRTHRQAWLSAFFSTAAATGRHIDLTIREKLVAELIVLGHHHSICRSYSHVSKNNPYIVYSGKRPGGSWQQTWIELCQKAGADPHHLVNANVDKLFEIILAASVVDGRVCTFVVFQYPY
jgi:hypothetical protein